MFLNLKPNKLLNMKQYYKNQIIIAILFFSCLVFINYKTNTYVIAEFENLRPFHNRAPVYYNGYKIGQVIKVKPNDDYTHTHVTIKFHPRKLKLPINIIANLRKEKNIWDRKFDYIDIIMPENPSGYLLKDGDRIAGKGTVELDSFLSNLATESLDGMRQDAEKILENLNSMILIFADLFATLNTMAQEASPHVVKVTSDLSKAASNTRNITQTFNNSFNEKRMDSTAKNIQLTTRNTKIMTNEINEIIPQLNCAVKEINRILDNIERMTSGLNCTMSKQFGGFRLFFGRPINIK